MFDRSVINATRYPSEINIRVDEKRAPTDDSIRIADEFHSKAVDRILGHNLFDNVVRGKLTWVQDRSDRSVTLVASFKVNGVEYHHELPEREVSMMRLRGEREMAEWVRERVGHAVAKALMKQSARELSRVFEDVGERA